jgi:molybdopterin converting factor small subunit
MMVEIKVFSTLRQHLPSSEERPEGDPWDIPEGETVAEVLDRLGIPGDQEMILLVNDLHVRKGRVLKEGDVVHIFPPLSGG